MQYTTLQTPKDISSYYEEIKNAVWAHIFGVGALANSVTLAEVARLAEDLGYHSIFVADHLIVPRGPDSKYPYTGDGSFPYAPDQDWLDPMAALGYLAGQTRTIRLGTSVTVLPMRHPIVTAKQKEGVAVYQSSD